MTKRLLLLGGGHAQVHVLQALAREPMVGTQVALITPFARQIYSGMVPGLVAGHYRAEQCAIALQPLAAAARVHFTLGAAVPRWRWTWRHAVSRWPTGASPRTTCSRSTPAP